jgi:predicted RNase H-like nuclease (RuvC/YqgF family)
MEVKKQVDLEMDEKENEIDSLVKELDDAKDQIDKLTAELEEAKKKQSQS